METNRKTTTAILAALFSTIILAGFVATASLKGEELAYYPNGQANHHPKSVTN